MDILHALKLSVDKLKNDIIQLLYMF